jgi:hypothetical protein
MALMTLTGGNKYDIATPGDVHDITTGVFRHELSQWRASRGKKRMEVTLPVQPASATVFLGPAEVAGMPEEGYIWSLKMVSATLAAAGTLIVYKATGSGDVRRPLGANPVMIPPAYTTTSISGASVPSSGVAFQNPTNQTYQVAINANGATISNVSVNGVTVGTAAGTYYVPAYGAISVTYTVATPQWTWTATQTNPPAAPLVQTLTWSSDAARLRHGEGLYLVASSNISEVFVGAWEVPAEMEADIYD